MAQLPLALRKNIRDFEPKLQENLAKIKAATGRDFTLEFDMAQFGEVSKTRGYENRTGEIVYQSILGPAATNIANHMKDEMIKAAFNAQVTNPVIKMVIDPAATGYGEPRLEGGQLIVAFKADKFCANVDELFRENLVTLFTVDGLSLETRLNLRKNEPKLQESLGKLKAATGRDWTLQYDAPLFAKTCETRGYKNRLGDCLLDSTVRGMTGNIVNLCKDDMSKEAFLDAVKNPAIKLVLSDASSGYGLASIEAGQLVITFRPGSFCANVDECAANLPKIL